jgi:hypothetical protein
LLQVSRRVLGVRDADSSAEDRAGGRADAGAAPAANCGADRRTETSTKNCAADSLGIGLVAQRGNLRFGILPAGLIIIVRLRQR